MYNGLQVTYLENKIKIINKIQNKKLILINQSHLIIVKLTIALEKLKWSSTIVINKRHVSEGTRKVQYGKTD